MSIINFINEITSRATLDAPPVGGSNQADIKILQSNLKHFLRMGKNEKGVDIELTGNATSCNALMDFVWYFGETKYFDRIARNNPQYGWSSLFNVELDEGISVNKKKMCLLLECEHCTVTSTIKLRESTIIPIHKAVPEDRERIENNFKLFADWIQEVQTSY